MTDTPDSATAFLDAVTDTFVAAHATYNDSTPDRAYLRHLAITALEIAAPLLVEVKHQREQAEHYRAETERLRTLFFAGEDTDQ